MVTAMFAIPLDNDGVVADSGVRLFVGRHSLVA
jgi:hypothetical protein